MRAKYHFFSFLVTLIFFGILMGVGVKQANSHGPTCPINRYGCESGCGNGYICESHGPNGFMCHEDDARVCGTVIENCTSIVGAPPPCCSPLQTIDVGTTHVCGYPPSGGQTCSGVGCNSNCAAGYGCVSGTCVVDPTCVADKPIYAPYQGPHIISFASILARVYRIIFPVAIVIAMIMILKAGYVLMWSEGNPQKVREGQEDLTAAILGALFVILSASILRFIIRSVLGGNVSL